MPDDDVDVVAEVTEEQVEEELPPADPQGPPAEEPDQFPRSYVEELRQETASGHNGPISSPNGCTPSLCAPRGGWPIHRLAVQ